MDLTTAIAIAAFVLSVLNSAVAVWAWRRRRAVASCERVNSALARLGDGRGLMVEGLGAFNAEGQKAYHELTDDLSLVADKPLRKVLNKLREDYEAAEAAAMKPADVDTLKMAAIKLDPDHPANKAAADIASGLRRLTILQRRASGL